MRKRHQGKLLYFLIKETMHGNIDWHIEDGKLRVNGKLIPFNFEVNLMSVIKNLFPYSDKPD